MPPVLAPNSPRFPPSAPLALCLSLVQTVGCVGLEMAVIFVLARLNLLYKWDDCQYVALLYVRLDISTKC